MSDALDTDQPDNILNLFVNSEELQAGMENSAMICDVTTEVLAGIYRYVESTRDSLIKFSLIDSLDDNNEPWFRAQRYEEFFLRLKIIQSSVEGMKYILETQIETVNADKTKANPEDRTRLEENLNRLNKLLESYRRLKSRIELISRTTKRDVLRTLDYKDKLVDVRLVEDGEFTENISGLPHLSIIPDIPDLKERLKTEYGSLVKNGGVSEEMEATGEKYKEELEPFLDDFKSNKHRFAELPEEAQELIERVFVNANKREILKRLVREDFVDTYQVWRDLVHDGYNFVDFEFYQNACYEVARIIYEFINVNNLGVPTSLDHKVEEVNDLYSKHWSGVNRLATTVREAEDHKPRTQIYNLRKYIENPSPFNKPNDEAVETVTKYIEILKKLMEFLPVATYDAGVHLALFEEITDTPYAKGQLYGLKYGVYGLYEELYDLIIKLMLEYIELTSLLDTCAFEDAFSQLSGSYLAGAIQHIKDKDDSEDE